MCLVQVLGCQVVCMSGGGGIRRQGNINQEASDQARVRKTYSSQNIDSNNSIPSGNKPYFIDVILKGGRGVKSKERRPCHLHCRVISLLWFGNEIRYCLDSSDFL